MAFGAPYPGKIVAIHLQDIGGELIIFIRWRCASWASSSASRRTSCGAMRSRGPASACGFRRGSFRSALLALDGVAGLALDVTTKPPGTIEWE